MSRTRYGMQPDVKVHANVLISRLVDLYHFKQSGKLYLPLL